MKTPIILSSLLILAAVGCAAIPAQSLITLWNLQGDSMGDQQNLLGFRALAVALFALVALLVLGVLALYALFPNLRPAASSLTPRFRYAIAAGIAFALAPGFFFVAFSIAAPLITRS